jgi:2-polyprenyl-3-methyl-5-hydroxy-6-metoxy-1,4-benzoquinol methylase
MDTLLKKQGSLSILFVLSLPRKRAKLNALRKCLPKIKPNQKCLDIGTGHGGLTYFYSRQGIWTFAELNENHSRVAKTILKGTFLSEKSENFLNDRSQFDLIASIDMITYLSDLKTFVRSCYEGLSKEGTLLISGMNNQPHRFFIRLRTYLKLEQAIGMKSVIYEKDLEKNLKEVGFLIEKEIQYFGVFSQAFQTLLDFIMVKRNQDGKDGLTLELDTKTKTTRLSLACFIIRPVTFLADILDKLFFFLPKYAYIFNAKKL